MANKDFKIKNGLDMSSPLPVAMGGTGQTSTTNTLNSLLPSQSGNANKLLASDGTNTTWVAQATAYQRGGTASRPASPTAGDLYYNTDYNYFESYTANGWFPIAAAPGIPTSVVATNQGSGRTYNNGQASVAFTAATTGGAPTSFILTPTPATSPTTFTGGSSPIVATGLASSTSYTYTVLATSPYGTTAASSASAGVIATTKPQTPTISVVATSATTATVSITSASGGETATYSISTSPVTTTQTTQSSSYLFTGLTALTEYTFTVTATNTNGTSAASNSVSITTPALDSGAMVQIGLVQVGSAGQANISFTSIPNTYKHLQIRATWVGSSDLSDNNMTFNTVGGTSYVSHYTYGDGSGTGSGVLTGPSGSYIGIGKTSSSATTRGSASVIDIFDYANASKYKTVRGLSGDDANGTGRVLFQSGLFMNNNAISSITFTPAAGTYSNYCQVALYGIKGE